MNALVIGSGAREHAIVRALLADPEVGRVDAAPGNPGIAEVATCHPLPDGVTDAAEIVRLAQQLDTDLVVIGPEVPLVAGVADTLRDAGITVFGPSGQAAQLEGSKAFAKEIMAAADVPTSRSYVCTNDTEAAAALEATGAPYVVKDDGLAAGKGVVVTDSMDAALAHARGCFAAGGSVVVEEFLSGPEVSLFCITDGTTVVPLAPAQDFKRVGDGDAGPNTGGMGAYSPLPWAPAGLVDDVVARIAQPTVDEMRRRGTPFAGVLYVGLALTPSGPRVIEFNARFGDPETQVVLARLRTPLGGLLRAAATGELDQQPPLVWREDAAVTVVVASEGYPATPRTGDPIEGLTDGDGESYVLHAGTARDDSGALVSAGGRVLSCVGTGPDLAAARAAAYGVVGAVSLRGSHHRSDIAQAAADGTLTFA
ncbi:phosphoribosylamine--glycine ligase [Flexivirga oryzae]|uniref:Phosphoribosylamine--glycine ligase n=1 Tax=Flexivirga oryzae TaxID=1794944 RepID=A0A839NBD8_9MICO|nr:phosphoribosylamine--glycine ligase [Flexivirga oryzae]